MMRNEIVLLAFCKIYKYISILYYKTISKLINKKKIIFSGNQILSFLNKKKNLHNFRENTFMI